MSKFIFENNHAQQLPEVKKEEIRVLEDTVGVLETVFKPISQEVRDEHCTQEDLVRHPDPSKPYQGIEVDSQENSYLAIMSMVKGSPWVVEYYQQYLGMDDETAGYSRDRLVPYQQYRRIRNFELRVTSPLSFSHSNDVEESELTGTAIIYPVIKPNVNDLFIADIGDGRTAIIVIDSVRRMSHRRYSAFEIEYHVHEYLNKQMHTNLIEKSVDTYVFDKNRLQMGNDPFIEEGTYESLAELEEAISRLPKTYYSHFFHEEVMSFMVPLGTDKATYDVRQVKFLHAIIDKSEYPKYRNLKLQRVDHVEDSRLMSIWEAILERDWLLIDECSTKFNVIDLDHVRGPNLMFNAYYGLFDQFIYPYHIEPTLNTVSIHPRFTAPAELPIFHEEDLTSNRKYIYPVGTNQDYVFSDYFYQEDTHQMSRLELQVYRFIRREALCPKEIYRLLQVYPRWDDLDRYYYGPLLYLLGKAVLNGE